MKSGLITRRGSKARGFAYEHESGQRVRGRATLERIETLRVPPAWRDVRIAESARSAIQAWGYDARGRKQYRYHPRALERGERRKYYRMRQMGRDLPAIRRALAHDFPSRGSASLSRKHVAAAAVRLISEAFFRVGSERYAKENRTFGLTTLNKSHVRRDGGCLVFSYEGKGAIRQRQFVSDSSLSRAVSRLMRAPGRRLFRYRTDDGWKDLTSRDVNEYLRALSKASYTAKDFRTWGGTLRVATVLGDLGPASSEAEAKRNVVLAIRLVASELGNTPAICRKSYVHPMVIARYLDEGATIAIGSGGSASRRSGFTHAPEERALIRFLDEYFPERRRRARHRHASPRNRSRANG